MKNLAQQLALRYGGTLAKRQLCEIFLRREEQLLFGIRLSDPAANYRLLTEHDFQRLSDTTAAACRKMQSSPFDDLLLIVYRSEEGKPQFKLLYGMAGRLVEEMAALCADEHIWQTLSEDL